LSGDLDRALREALKNQYHAGLAAVHQAVELCPDELWDDGDYTNRFWQVAYHALFFTHLYLQPRLEDWVAWSGHQSDVQHEDGIGGPPYPDSDKPLIPDPYTKEQVLVYCDFCRSLIDDGVDALDLTSPESGFYWYPVSKVEHQLVNIRHLQHHAAQLADRLRNEADVGVRWVGTRPKH